MPRSLVRRAAALSVLALLLAAPWSAAEPRRQHEAQPRPLAQLWSRLIAVWGEIGCVIDPGGGLCRDAAPASPADIGCGIDPHGGGCQ